MTSHLDDAELADLLAGADAAAGGGQRHLAACRDCESEHARVAAAIAGWRQALVRESQRSESYWRAREQAVLAHLRTEPSRWLRPAGRWAIAGAAAVALAIGLGPLVAPPRAELAAPTDETLLVAVEDAVGRWAPEALAPAEVLVEELELAARAGGDS